VGQADVGGSSASITIINSLFVENSAEIGGAIIGLRVDINLINSTITNNSATRTDFRGGGGLISAQNSTTILNSIIWGNTAGTGNGNDIYNLESTITGTYSLHGDDPDDVEGDFTCTNCTSDAPNFVNPGAGNYQLSEDSPAIDAGDPATDLSVFPGGPTNPVDLNGAARVHGGIIDIGAYEFGGPLPDQIFADRFQ
jgi:hypothetical protein